MSATGNSADATVEAEIGKQVLGTPDGTLVRGLVSNGWSAAQGYATSAFSTANSLIASLNAIAAQLATVPNVDATLADVAGGLRGITLGDLPTVDPNLAGIEDNISQLAQIFSPQSFSFTGTVAFTDQDYTSPELTHLISTLDSWVTGTDTGIPADVEAQLWQRSRDRDVKASRKKSEEALRQFAARGFTKPPGALALELQDAAQEQQNADVTNSREVAIKQADLQQSNRRFAFEKAGELQRALITYMQDKMRRALEAANDNLRAAVDGFGHQIQAYSANAGFYGSLVGAQASLTKSIADIRIAEGNLRVEASRANVQALIEKAQLAVTLQRALADIGIQEGNLRLEQSRANVQAMIQKTVAGLESVRGAAQVSAQLAAAALSAVNLSGSLHDATSWGLSVSESRSRNISAGISSSESASYSYTP